MKWYWTVWLCVASGQALAQAREPCSVPGVGFVANNTIAECARIGQAAQGHSVWGGHTLVTQNGRVLIDGRAQALVVNPSGTVGSLSQRCARGDQGACGLWAQQSHQNAERMKQMYPQGWNRQ
jgi:hypothetical protein